MVDRRGIVILLICFDVGSCIETYYMDINCRKTLYFSTYSLHQIRLKFTSRSSYQPNTDCYFSISTAFPDRLMFYFKSVRTVSCSHAYLNVYDGPMGSTRTIPGLDTQCGYHTSTSAVYTTTGSSMTLHFVSDYSRFVDTGFDMVITSYNTGPCLSHEHSCNNGRCIDDDLECNGYNPCGDFSDCHANVVVGVTVGVVTSFSLVVIVAIIFIIWRRRQRERSRPFIVTETRSYGTANYGYNQQPPAYPGGPQYPAPGQPYPATGQQNGPSAPPPQLPQTNTTSYTQN